jgi:thymidylate synthase ThyX
VYVQNSTRYANRRKPVMDPVPLLKLAKFRSDQKKLLNDLNSEVISEDGDLSEQLIPAESSDEESKETRDEVSQLSKSTLLDLLADKKRAHA